MPSVDELLDDAVLEQSLDDKSVIQDANEYLEIDPVKRQVIIPDDELIFGVQHDLDGERKHFKVARYVGNNLDMSKAHIYINYTNAAGDADSYVVTDVAIEGEAVTFSWVLSSRATAYKGDILFVVCARWSTSDGTETNRWHTTLAKGTSLEGLETEPIVLEKYPDIFEQLLNLYETNVTNELTYNSADRVVNLKKNEDSEKSLLELYTNDATATDRNIEQGYTAYVKGKKIQGVLSSSADISVALGTPTFKIVELDPVLGVRPKINMLSFTTTVSLKDTSSALILKGSQKKSVTANISADNFGDATASDVRKGKTFTSVNGLKIVGTGNF